VRGGSYEDWLLPSFEGEAIDPSSSALPLIRSLPGSTEGPVHRLRSTL
jgi:hypothetical protein